MMLENVFPKIKLFLKGRLKPFTTLYLAQKRAMEKSQQKANTSNQDKNKNVL